ncbi:MAG: DUF3291 domain-containing protein [Candidatus Latescibacteria bacterium]|nr:DUF3291 domain-containing protein [Candidatus Latescibacterota bacterium]
MPTQPQHLAQLNIAHMKAPLDDPLMADFVAQIEAVNALAEKSPGFVWRLQTPAGDALALRPFDDPATLVNMSVWESVEALHHFVYSGDHLEVFKQKKAWFERMAQAHMVLWWIPQGHQPSLVEAQERLQHLQNHGHSSTAFTFRHPYPAP